jgi:hypothetical protein
MNKKFRFPAVVALAAFLAGSLAAPAASNITIYAGAEIHGRMRDALDSANAYVGQKFTMDVVPPYPSGNPAFSGAIMVGEVTRVVHAGQGVKPEINVRFDYLRLSDGTIADISGGMTNSAKSNTLRNGGHVALTTLGGMIAGNIIGKTVFRTNAGGLIGAVGGFLYGYNQKSNYTIPAGSEATVQITKTVVIRRQSHR